MAVRKLPAMADRLQPSGGHPCFGLEQLEDASGEEAFQAAADFSVRLALGTPALDVTSRLLVTGPADEHGTVEGAVELSVTSSTEPVADRLSRRCGDRRNAGQGGARGPATRAHGASGADSPER